MIFGGRYITTVATQCPFKLLSKSHYSKFSAITSKFTMPIKTFVFLDSETTGLPSQEHNKTRMTELCFTAVQSDHIRLGAFPRIQNKITLCFNPRKFIHPIATTVSGLSNDLLEFQSDFNDTTCSIIKNFLSLQRPPICFVAHNGERFDYPILRAELYRTGHELPDDILCIDTLTAFRDMYDMDMRDFYEGKPAQPGENPEGLQELPPEFQDGYDELLCTIVDDLENSGELKKLSIEEIQKINETTPKKTNNNTIQPSTNKNNGNKIQTNGNKGIRRQLPFGRPSFKLSDVYTRLTSKAPTDAHRAEYDVSMLIECAAVLGEKFVDWSNCHVKKFSDIPMMAPGKYIGT